MKTAFDYFKAMVVTMDFDSMSKSEQEQTLNYFDSKEAFIENMVSECYGVFGNRTSFLSHYLSDMEDSVVEEYRSKESAIKFLNLIGGLDDELKRISERAIERINEE